MSEQRKEGSVYTHVYSDIGGRRENEDTAELHVHRNNLIAVVADGLGGHGDGKKASELVCQRLLQCGADNQPVSRERLETAFQAANEALIGQQQNRFHMKTTAVYLCIHENQAIWAHIGDSRLYHFYQGELQEYTLDHSISQLAVTMGEIRREEIPSYPGRSRLYHAMGTEEEYPEIHDPITLAAGRHGFLLCTDGLWEYVTDREIQEALQESETAKEWVRRLRDRMESRCQEEHDNNTAVAIILETDGGTEEGRERES